VALLQPAHPDLHAIVAGEDRVFYGPPAPAGETWKSAVLKSLPNLDRSRVHFVGSLPLARYRDLLRATTVHVYLTVPFVLSWSLIEAMATGCAIVASDTAPVREVMADRRDGLLAPFAAPEAIAARIAEMLSTEILRRDLARSARATALDRFDRAKLIPAQVAQIRDVAALSLSENDFHAPLS